MTVKGSMALKDVKNHLTEVVDQVEREHDRVVITKYGRPAAVVLSVDDLASLEETLDIAAWPALMRQLRMLGAGSLQCRVTTGKAFVGRWRVRTLPAVDGVHARRVPATRRRTGCVAGGFVLTSAKTPYQDGGGVALEGGREVDKLERLARSERGGQRGRGGRGSCCSPL